MPMSAMKAAFKLPNAARFINKEGWDDYHSTLHASHLFALGKRRSLEMQNTHHTIRTHAFIVLAELHLVAHQWLYLLFKLSLTKAFKEIATSISKKARLNNEHAFNISLYYFHFINFNRFV